MKRGVAGGISERTPAREMSDGLLRFMGIATAAALVEGTHGSCRDIREIRGHLREKHKFWHSLQSPTGP